MIIVILLIAGLGLYLIQGFLRERQKGFKRSGAKNLIGEAGTVPNLSDFSFKPNDLVLEKVSPGKPFIVEKVLLESPGFVVVYKDREASIKNVIGYSYLLPKGETRNVYISLKEDLKEGQVIFVGIRFDDGDGFFEYSGKYDKNLSTSSGKVIFWEVRVGR